ncbi:MAG: cation tolerance protein CutA [Mesorhizobium amorphae]|nr:MAG: cation tolerance protein CutA [Mesorhizobium amorphae]
MFRPLRRWRPQLAYVLWTLVIASLLVFSVEWVVRGSLDATLAFFSQPFRPSWTTVALFALVFWLLDAALGRAYNGVLVVAPVLLALAFVNHQKAFYLGDPLYPTDFLYARQILELLPLLAGDRPWTAAAACIGTVAGIGLAVWGWRVMRRRLPRLRPRARLMRLGAAIPALVFFASIMDYASFSWARDRLQIVPMMWDQRENYASNGFAIAFALNVPMAKVSAPKGYDEKALAAIETPVPAISMPGERPDIIVVMSESFWDPTRLPKTTIAPDPMPTVRAASTGHVFSPEFGGMTANVEFEALTGFSNAFLPYGSIPYQQYVRSALPSLAGFLKSEGYETRAIHPFAGWFWNRKTVYDAFGFEHFSAEENLPYLAKRGPLASDAALTEQIIAQAESTRDPVFLFAVSLQNHGPYEANRYADPSLSVEGAMPDASRAAILSYAEGVSDADKGLARLMDWASKRERHTVIAFFGDHLPPLGQPYIDTGFLRDMVPPKREPLAQLLSHRETPLVVWSNRNGRAEDIGTVSPAFLPLLVLREAGIEHPYYTGFLGAVRERFAVLDRHVLMDQAGGETADWSRDKAVDPAVRDFNFLQYDLMFGKKWGADRFFPKPKDDPTPLG